MVFFFFGFLFAPCPGLAFSCFIGGANVHDIQQSVGVWHLSLSLLLLLEEYCNSYFCYSYVVLVEASNLSYMLILILILIFVTILLVHL